MPSKTSTKNSKVVDAKTASIPARVKEATKPNPNTVGVSTNSASGSGGKPDKVAYDREQGILKTDIDVLQARLVRFLSHRSIDTIESLY